MAPIAEASLGSKGLIVNGGKTVVLAKGEKRWIPVRDGFGKYPILKGLTFISENPAVFSVGTHSGIIRANGRGTATLSVVDKKGNCGRVTVTVNGQQKLSFGWLLLLPVLIVLLGNKQLKYLLRKK